MVLAFILNISEMLTIDKLRVNVVIVAGLITYLIVDFGAALIALLVGSQSPNRRRSSQLWPYL